MMKRVMELNQLAQDKEGKARIDALRQLKVSELESAKNMPTETTPDDTAADETVEGEAIADKMATSNEVVPGQYSETAPPRPASQIWWDDREFNASGLDLNDNSFAGKGTLCSHRPTLKMIYIVPGLLAVRS